MILTEQEIKDAVGFTTDQMVAYRKVESAVLERLKMQEPDKTKTKIECVTGAIYKYISGYLYPREVIAAAQYIVHRYCTTPDDVVRDAERLDWLMNFGRMVICDKEGCYTYTHTSGRYGPVAKTQREAIDLAMKEMK